MLAVRVIPCLDVDAGRVVKGVQFVEIRDAGDPVELAARYDAEGADELVFLDITASSDDRDTMVHVVERVADQVFIPFTVGGGIRSVEDVRRMLRAGADKVSLNTAAVNDPDIVRAGADEFGNQCIVVAIDARRRNADDPGAGWEVVTHGGRTPTGLDAVEWAVHACDLGAGEILAHLDGPRRHQGRLRHRPAARRRRRGRRAGDRERRASARSSTSAQGRPTAARPGLLAASIFHFGQLTVREAKAALAAHGLTVRPA